MNKNSSFYYILTVLWLIAAVAAGHLGLLGSVRPPLIIPVLVLLLVVASFAVPSFRSWLCSISLSTPPGQQLVDSVDLVVGDAAENIGKPCLRIDTVEFGRLNQCVGDGGGFASFVRSHE